MRNFAKLSTVYDNVFGALNSLLLAASLFQVAWILWFRIKLTAFKWVHLLTLLCINFITVIAFLWFARSYSEFHCNFPEKFSIQIENVLLFNVCIVIGYRVSIIMQSIYSFATKARLPSEKTKRRHNNIMTCLWIFSVFHLCVYVGFITFSIFSEDTQQHMYLINFANQSAITAFFWICTLMFCRANQRTRRILDICQKDRYYEEFLVYKRTMFLTFWSMLVVSALLTSRIFVVGSYSTTEIVINYFIGFLYVFIKIELQVIISRLHFSEELRSQVHGNGQILVYTVDERGKEAIHFYVNQPKRRLASFLNDPGPGCQRNIAE